MKIPNLFNSSLIYALKNQHKKLMVYEPDIPYAGSSFFKNYIKDENILINIVKETNILPQLITRNSGHVFESFWVFPHKKKVVLTFYSSSVCLSHYGFNGALFYDKVFDQYSRENISNINLEVINLVKKYSVKNENKN
jgi:hypothetical protein